MFYRDTWAKIDLDAIKHNLSIIKQQTNKAIFAVLKANAYGHCDYWVAKTAMDNGAEMVAVAYLDEALSLRKQGFMDEILVLGYVREEDCEIVLREKITLTAISLEWLYNLLNYHPDLSGLKFHIKFDSGMNRIGMKLMSDIHEAIKLIISHGGIVDGLYTHYACADENDLSYCDFQYKNFKEIVASLPIDIKWIHCENSAAVLQYPDELSNAVRVGLILYGISPLAKHFNLLPSLSLFACMTCVKAVKKGEYVGYGATYQASEDCFIATLPIGYADGFLRANQGRMMVVDGEEVEIVGRICMDQCMIKLNKGYPIKTVVEIISDKMPITRIAEELNTIPYEVLCLLSDRIPRVIFEDGKRIAIINNRLHEFY